MEQQEAGTETSLLRAEPRLARQVVVVPRQRGLWLALTLLLLVVAGGYMLQRYELHGLQRQLVATQDSFAGLGEESLQYLQQLDVRTAGLPGLQGRVQGLVAQLVAVQQQLQQQETVAIQLQALQEAQTGLEQKVPDFSRQLVEQSHTVEQVALTLDRAQQQLKTALEQQAREGLARVEELSAQTKLLSESLQELRSLWPIELARLTTLEEQVSASRERLQSLESLHQLDESFVRLQQSVLALAQQVEDDRKQRQELADEMSAFRLQVTRAQDRMQQRLDQLAQ